MKAAASMFLCVGVAGCVTVESAYQSRGAQAASFDLQCPADQIELSVLERNEGLGCSGSKIGVRGCGKQTTYICDNAQSWIRESEVQAEAAR